MRFYLLVRVYCCVLFVVDRACVQDTRSDDVPPAQKWEHFKALEAENPELAWEKLKLWFKNNGNIQHVKQPWKDFRIFKDSLILEHLKSIEDPVEQDTSEQKIEEAWREFEKVEEAVGGLSEDDKVDVVLDKFREFYTQVKEEGAEEGEQDEGQVVEEGGEGEEEEGSVEAGADQVEQGSVGEGEQEPESLNDPTVSTAEMNGADTMGSGSEEETKEEKTETESVAEEAAESIADDAAESADLETGESESESESEGEVSGQETSPVGQEETIPVEEPQENDQANEIEQKAAVESELVKALSAEMLTKFEELRQENSALKERISALESGLSEKIDTLGSELEELKKQVEEEPENDINTSATNVQEVQDLISKSLKLYAADEVGMPDYALESSGAVVFTIGETEPYTRDTPWMGVFGISIWRSCKTPRLAIQKDNSPGNCWSFTGDKGSLTIQLSAQVFPEYFTMDHIPLELAPNGNASSAPNHFRVLGLDYGNAPKGHVLGNYEFTEFPIQTFAVQQNPYEKYFRFVKVEILSNHGNKDYTCLYRFRVHGRPHDTDSYNG